MPQATASPDASTAAWPGCAGALDVGGGTGATEDRLGEVAELEAPDHESVVRGWPVPDVQPLISVLSVRTSNPMAPSIRFIDSTVLSGPAGSTRSGARHRAETAPPAGRLATSISGWRGVARFAPWNRPACGVTIGGGRT